MLRSLVGSEMCIRDRSKVKKVDEVEERICKHCFKSYKDPENFNWSCKRHSSPYSENVYFCCGKTNKDAPGCVTSKHEAKDDINFSEDSDKQVVYCSSCKTNGHFHYECPKDPNVRSTFTPGDELHRISKRWQMKERTELTNHQFTLQKRMMELVNPEDLFERESDISVEEKIV